MVSISLLRFLPYIFLFFVVIGLKTRKSVPERKPNKRFAVVVPAHNEEQVIRELITNIKRLNYPDHLYDIFVVADNCSDMTAARAEETGVEVITRFNQEKKR